MKKELDINIEAPIVTECWNFCRLAVIMTEDNEAWFADKFWEVNVYDGFIAFYYEIDSERWAMPSYDRVLRTERMSCRKDIVPQIIEAIDNNGYPFLYIQTDGEVGINHEVLVYGYNTDEENISCLVYNGVSNCWEKQKISYNEIERCLKREVEFLKSDRFSMLYYWGMEYPASVLYKKDASDLKPDLNIIYRTIRRMLYSGYQGATGIRLFYSQGERWVNLHRGIEIYKMYTEQLCGLLKENENYIIENFNVVVSVNKILESKKKIVQKLRYLQREKYIPNVECIIRQLNKVCENIEMALLALEKYYIRKSDLYIDRMKEYFQHAEIIEKAVLEQLLVIFEEEIKLRFLEKK